MTENELGLELTRMKKLCLVSVCLLGRQPRNTRRLGWSQLGEQVNRDHWQSMLGYSGVYISNQWIAFLAPSDWVLYSV